jgi:aerobic C4-dicarboxylate transport protein
MPRMWKSLYVQVLLGIVLGVLVGAIWPDAGAALQPLANGFIRLVRMIIAPVIFLTIVTGIGHMHGLGALGRLAWKAFAYFIAVSTLALIVGLLVGNLVRPGAGMNIDPTTLDAAAVSSYVKQAQEQTLTGFLLGIIPDTMLGALANGEILQVLLISILTGVAAVLVGARAEPFLKFCESANAVVFRVVDLLMRLAPLGAFGGMAFTIGKYGLGSLTSLAALVGTFYLTAIVFVLLILGTIAWLNGFSILRLIAYLRSELLLVLGTSSSEAALPRLIEKMEQAGCHRSVAGVVVPTGYSFNLDGTNIYMTLATLFIAQATNTPVPLGDQLVLLLVAMLSSKGAAGVTGSGFITLAATLSILPTVPVAGMALLLGVDRFMSECRALTNFTGNAVATVVVSRWERALDVKLLQRALRRGD